MQRIAEKIDQLRNSSAVTKLTSYCVVDLLNSFKYAELSPQGYISDLLDVYVGIP